MTIIVTRAAHGPQGGLRGAPGRPERSARRLGRAGCRRGGGEGPGRVAGTGRGAVLEKLRVGAFFAFLLAYFRKSICNTLF